MSGVWVRGVLHVYCSTRRQTPALFVDEQLRGNDPAHLSLAALSSDLSSMKPSQWPLAQG